jgi:hypothetical protein
LAYAGIPYQVLGVRFGAVFLTIAWIRSPRARSSGDIDASASRTAVSPSSAAFSSLARALIAAFSSAENPSFFLVGSSCSFRSFDDLREAVEPLQPRADALEGVGREHAPPDTADLLGS